VTGAPPAVVLRLVPDRLHYGAVAAARTLGRLGAPVYVVDDERRTVAARSRFTTGTVCLNGAATFEDVVRVLLELAGRAGDRPVLIPFDDVAALLVDRHAEELHDAFVFQRQPPALVETLLNKWTMTELARRHDIPVPETLRASSEDEAEDLLGRLSYPLVLKGAESYIPGTSERADLLVVENQPAARSAYRAMSEAERANVLFQEYIPGGADSIWMFNGYFDGDSDCRVAFTGRKLRQWPPDTGATSLGVAVPNEEVAALTKRFMTAIGYRGVLDIGYRYDERDGRYKVLDVNPRLGSTFRLFVDERTKLDVARALYLDLTGQEIPPAEQPHERKWLVEDRDLRASLAYRRAGRLEVRGWLRSLRGTDEAAWFAWSDPAPFVAMLLRMTRASIRRARRRLRGGAR
jgi:predicted ATP-grasp superfamily ATP-dependent carboligase